jgi:adenosylcobinamide-GDP ribazoletransferase
MKNHSNAKLLAFGDRRQEGRAAAGTRIAEHIAVRVDPGPVRRYPGLPGRFPTEEIHHVQPALRCAVTGVANRELRGLWAAAIFFTRLPLPSLPDLLPEDERRAIVYWPVLGAAIGAAVASVWWLTARIWPSGVAAGLAVAAGLLLTGALHEDGFADICDGLGGGRTRERALEIMRDSRVGAFGAIGVVMLLGLKWQAMTAMPAAVLPGALIAAHALSRGSLPLLMLILPYARTQGGAAQHMAVRPGGRLACAAILSLLPLLLLPRAAWPACLVASALVWCGCYLLFRRRLGGYTGDCLGAAQQLCEAAILLACLATA